MSLLYDALQKAEGDRTAPGAEDDTAADDLPRAPQTVSVASTRRVVAGVVVALVAVTGLALRHHAASRREWIGPAVGQPASGVAGESAPSARDAAPAADAAPVAPAADVAPIAPAADVAPLVPAKDAAAAASRPQRADTPAVASVAARALERAPVTPAAARLPPPSAAGQAQASARIRGFIIQVGAFKSHENALRLQSRLAPTHPNVTVRPPSSDGALWVVSVGPYSDRLAASVAQMTIAREGIAGIVVAGAD